ncbi:unnamed protein product [Ectocarpus sp. 6 AP-2014]
MMVPEGDEEDDFIVPTTPAAAAEVGSSDDAQADASTRGWGSYLGGLVFARAKEPAPASEPEPTLPSGFSATLNAEEEKIYPAEAKIRVLVAEGSLLGRNRRQAAELHQALQQVVGAAAIYNHLLVKHGGLGTKPKECKTSIDATAAAAGTAAEKNDNRAVCGCGGGSGSCKAISSLLKSEMDKVVAAAEKERKGEMLKKFKQVERRSGGLCNPDLLENIVRSTGGEGSGESSPSASKTSNPPPPSPLPPRSPDHKGQDAAIRALNSLVVVDVEKDERGGIAGVGGSGGAVSSGAQDVPWAEDMLCRSVRKRHAAVLKTRGRALAKGLARMLKGVSNDLKGVASRLPPWEECEDDDEDKPTPQEEGAELDRIRSRGNIFSAPTHERIHSRGEVCVPLTHDRSLSHGSCVSAATSEDGNERLSLSSDTAPTAASISSNGSAAIRSPVAAMAAAVAAVVSPGSDAVPAAVPGGGATSSSGGAGGGAANCVRSRRQDLKLSAQELSLIKKEEERVMKPDVLTTLLAKGASLGCLQQADFWDVFARLEVATRTEALLNIAIRGGRGCAARSGRMGRELCINLTSVVLEALNAVEQAQRKAQLHSTPTTPNPQQQQQQQQQRRPSSGNFSGGGRSESKAAETRPRPSSARLSRGSDFGLEAGMDTGGAARARAGSVGMLAVRRVVKGESVAGKSRVFYKEDPGLKDLDRREEEFRKAIYVNRRALATRLMRLTRDAPLCSRVLGTFVDDTQRASTPTKASKPQNSPRSTGVRTPQGGAAPQNESSRFATSPGKTAEEVDTAVWNSSSVGESVAGRGGGAPGAAAAAVDLLTGEDVTVGGEGSSCAADRGSTESHPSSSGSVTSTNTEPLSEGTEDSDNAPASTSPARQQRKQQQEGPHEEKVAVDQATVAEILQVSEESVEVETLLV